MSHVQGNEKNHFQENVLQEQSEERTGIWTEYMFPSQTDLALQCVLPRGGNIFSFEENFILVKLHFFDSPKDLCQLWFTKDQWFWLSTAVSGIKILSCLPSLGAEKIQAVSQQ